MSFSECDATERYAIEQEVQRLKQEYDSNLLYASTGYEPRFDAIVEATDALMELWHTKGWDIKPKVYEVAVKGALVQIRGIALEFKGQLLRRCSVCNGRVWECKCSESRLAPTGNIFNETGRRCASRDTLTKRVKKSGSTTSEAAFWCDIMNDGVYYTPLTEVDYFLKLNYPLLTFVPSAGDGNASGYYYSRDAFVEHCAPIFIPFNDGQLVQMYKLVLAKEAAQLERARARR